MTTHWCLISHPTEPRVLLAQRPGGWTLPEIATSDAPIMRQELRQRYGLDATLLTSVAGRFLDAEHDEEEHVYALECHGVAPALPPAARWATLAELAALAPEPVAYRPASEQWLRELAGAPVPAQRAPWARRGWYAEAAAWLVERLAALGYQQIGAVEQVHARGWSTVLRVPAHTGWIYFKAVAGGGFEFEPLLTRALARRCGGQVPAIVAVDEARHWLVTEDAGPALLGSARADPAAATEVLARALAEYARLQQVTAPVVDEWIAATGCPDRRLERLPALYRALVDDRAALLVGEPGGLSAADHARLRAGAPAVADLCARLAGYRLPSATIHHEELSPTHIIPNGERTIYFDWGDSCVTHPLASLMMALRWPRLVLGWDAATLDRQRDAYLDAWTAWEPLERLREAAALADRVALLCRALTWHAVTTHAEPGARWEYADRAPYWLALFLHGEEQAPAP
jgi:hypothetical protein